ncbi:MAG: UvrD-helicase domain-containing protein [Nannocystaceae bacterium]
MGGGLELAGQGGGGLRGAAAVVCQRELANDPPDPFFGGGILSSFCYFKWIVSERLDDQQNETVPSAAPRLSSRGEQIVRDETEILARILARLASDAANGVERIEDLDGQLIELRDMIGEAKEEDVASLVDQMHQVAALSRKRGKGRALPVDPLNPYFGHLRIKDARSGRPRDVLIGKRTLLDDGGGLAIVDWRNAPISRLYYRYEEEEEYEEQFDNRSLEGTLQVRRSLAVFESELRRINAPQGSFARDTADRWRELAGASRPTLEGGLGSAVRMPRGKLGVAEDDIHRKDKHLQEITALIDREQFGLITEEDSGIVLIQGGAGSGKTTVALHRVAYLSFQDSRRFAPSKMMIVVFNDALVEYIKHVLPSLGVAGVAVTTYRRWTQQLLRRVKIDLPRGRTDATPEAVTRFKKHPIVLSIIEELVGEQLAEAEASLTERVTGHSGGEQVLAAWRSLDRLPPVVRVQRTIHWLRSGRGQTISARARNAAEAVLDSIRGDVGDVVSDWMDLLGDGKRLRRAVAEYAPAAFSAGEISIVAKWCANRAEELVAFQERGAERAHTKADQGVADEDGEVASAIVEPELDEEDDAIFLRLLQCKFGGVFSGSRRIEYEHVVIDEAQDLCPLEVRVLLDCVTKGKSVTIAGDKAQKMIFDNGFVDWPQLLGDAGLPHVEVQPLKITYRSTRQVMALARGVLGPLHDERDDLIARDGAPVAYHSFSDVGESVAFLGAALRSLMQREPTASVAVVTRYPQQAELYYDALRVAEVPRMRLVAQQDFSFLPGIDVTDVRQVKGLEFDYVIVADPTRQNYPDTVASRHLLHIACTRTAYQLWLVCAGRASELLPAQLVNSGELSLG